ncbi:helix-turn-helix domain-containing protein [Geminisphaera colitermitum]|uniref:helix-turn-helix domain-containing protein n=1 Tax=Geminisphaera colitermitum TaxID=1148786 RepID=UPI000158C620|nr:helix-turn-helix transcriptional regulator [Geminisphaera colitermitum]
MKFFVTTPVQLRTQLRTLRQSRSLSQEQVGELLGVNQKRIARIEAAPDVTGFGQIARLVSALGGRIVIEDASSPPVPGGGNKGKVRKAASSRPGNARKGQADW